MNDYNYISAEIGRVRASETWHSPSLQMDMTLIRYGHYGMPLLLYPTAGGDAAEPERFYLVRCLEPFIREGRLKVYCVDSIAGRTWMTESNVPHAVWIQKQFDACIREEVVPAIRTDCRNDNIEIMTAGASIGAFNALLTICRHPDVFNRALCMSGTFDLQKWLQGQWYDEFYYLSPLHFVPNLPEGEQLDRLRSRNILIVTGTGDYENPDESWKVAHALGSRGIPNRIDLWEEHWRHDWETWREMIPQYVQEMLVSLNH